MQKEFACIDRESWLQLWRVPGIGASTFHKLLGSFQAPREVLRASAPHLASIGLTAPLISAIRSANAASIAPDLKWLDEDDHSLVCYDDPRYPTQLREIHTPPPLLFVNGDASWLQRPQIAIVGSRRATRGGLDFAFELSRELAARGFIVTSGLAHGIDAQAHRGCLAAGQGTVAVMGTGAETIYPRAHCRLAREILNAGALVSEFPVGCELRPENFPQRNRIISGLALGVVVVEAAAASGSLITARLAAEQGREVFAVPGSVHNPQAHGCHALIKQGAKLVETAEDIVEEFPTFALQASPLAQAATGAAEQAGVSACELTAEQALTLQCMGYDPVPIDLLVDRTGLTAPALSSILLALEINGRVAAHAGGVFMRVGPETR